MATTSKVRQLPDGEELVRLDDLDENLSGPEADPREPWFQHRSEAVSNRRPADDQPRGRNASPATVGGGR